MPCSDEKVTSGAEYIINSDYIRSNSFVSIDQQESEKEEEEENKIPRGSPVSSRFYSLPGSRSSSPVPEDKVDKIYYIYLSRQSY